MPPSAVTAADAEDDSAPVIGPVDVTLDGVVEEHGERYEFFKADIANADQMDSVMTEHQFFAVINFAAESHVDRSINDPLNFIHTNVIGTSVLLDCARRHGVQRALRILDRKTQEVEIEARVVAATRSFARNRRRWSSLYERYSARPPAKKPAAEPAPAPAATTTAFSAR